MRRSQWRARRRRAAADPLDGDCREGVPRHARHRHAVL